MSVATARHAEAGPAPPGDTTAQLGPIGRLGGWTAAHFRVVLSAWIVIAVGLGFFAPRVETALSGVGARAWYLPAWARRVLPKVRFGHG